MGGPLGEARVIVSSLEVAMMNHVRMIVDMVVGVGCAFCATMY